MTLQQRHGEGGRPLFGADRYAQSAFGQLEDLGPDVFVAIRGLSETVVPGFDDRAMEIVGDDPRAVDVARGRLLGRWEGRELWVEPTLAMELQRYVAALATRGDIYVHFVFEQPSPSEPWVPVDTTWLAPETLVARWAKGGKVYEQFMSAGRFAGEPVREDGELRDALVEILATEVLHLRWPLDVPGPDHSPVRGVRALERRVTRESHRSLLALRAQADQEETFLPLARARAGAYADALEEQQAASARIKDLLLYPGAYEAETFPWAGDVTDYFLAERILRARIGICRVREYLFDEVNRQVLAHWSALNGWGEVRLRLRADVFSEADWRDMLDELTRGRVSLDDVRAAVIAEFESGHASRT